MNKALFKYYMEVGGFTVETLAKAVNMHQITMYNKLNGKTEFTPSEIVDLTKVLGLTVDEMNKVFFYQLVC